MTIIDVIYLKFSGKISFADSPPYKYLLRKTEAMEVNTSDKEVN